MLPAGQWRRGESQQNPTGELHRPTEPGPLTSPPLTPAVELGELDGTWGERDGAEIDEEQAIREYEALRHNLEHLHQTKTKDSQVSRKTGGGAAAALWRSISRGQAPGDHDDDSDRDVEAGNQGEDADEGFKLGEFMREGRFEKRTEEGAAKRVGVLYENLTVKGVVSTETTVRTVPDAIVGTFGPDLYKILCDWFPALRFRKPPVRTLLSDFTGCVRAGEMLLVLGRPGSGCSTFLKAATNNRSAYAAVEGDVSYGGISAERQAQMYRGEVNYNGEEDIHFASLSVWKTLVFALTNKTRKGESADVPIVADALMRMFGISHTRHTVVGDDVLRGVSGGERKRVSIAETLASKSSVMAWDNSTRGLDASTALDYARSLRIMTDVTSRTTLVTLYQAGEGIFDVMDKVLVIDAGRQIFSGPAGKAKQYFVDLGFECPDGQTTADFLTAVTDPHERRFRPGFENKAPRSAEEFEVAFRSSENYQEMLADVREYKSHLTQTDFEDMKKFEGAMGESKSRFVSARSPYTVSFARQVWACTRREFWLLLGDTTALWTKFFIVVANALIVGSLFFGQPLTTAGAFSRGSTAFFSIVFLGWLQLSELMKAVSGRDVISRHSDYAFYRPSAVSLARVLHDLPVVAIQVAIFSTTLYFMTGLDVDAGKFWIYILLVYVTTIMLTALYRLFAAMSPNIDTAVRFSSIALSLLVLFTGYVMPKWQLLEQRIWFGWLYWVNPISYAFEVAMTNEFSGRDMQCAPQHTVPRGPGVQEGFQGCAITGATPNSLVVPGEAYLASAYGYSRANLWRDIGVVIAFGVLYILCTIVATQFLDFSDDANSGAIVYKEGRRSGASAAQSKQKEKSNAVPDPEKMVGSGNEDSNALPPAVGADVKETLGGGRASGSGSSSSGNHDEADTADEQEAALASLSKSQSIFTWRNVEYTVPYMGGTRKILNGVNGYAKPGLMVALMGASGAGKTTLLNCLSQRLKTGVIGGEMLVDGKALGADFQRNTGFCLQGDIHDTTQTVREAIEFSALLRQEAHIPRAEKLAYVDHIIDLLELGELQDAIIESLGVEQRKRLTIGVELAAKPSLLLFLDEPTSGLDSQGAYSIVRFLKKLSRAGQAIVCTIHQPSAVLIQQFDLVLALNPGGNTFYFGPIGDNGSDVKRYFADRGAACPADKNVAEFILETAARPHRRPDGSKVDWNQEWVNSDNAQQVLDEIDGLKRTRSHATGGDGTAAGDDKIRSEYAASTWVQTVELTKRMFRQYWRDPAYIYGKLFVAIIMGVFNGFTFWQVGDSVGELQNRMFSVMIIITIPPTIVNAVVPKFYDNMKLWEEREYPSRTYGWVAFCTANIVAELPAALLVGVLYWATWYWPAGLSADGGVAGYSFLMTVLMFLFLTSWGQWICAFAPSFTVISNVLPFFFVMFGLFNGIVTPYSMLPAFWRDWVYWANPSTHWMAGLLASSLDGVPVNCKPEETARFDAPPGQTCFDYAGDFAFGAGGYLLNPNATADCQYCPYRTGTEYLATINIYPETKWREFGIFLTFCVSNMMLVYFFIYTVRIRGWTFGFASVFGGLGNGMRMLKSKFAKAK